jgi:RimJ/RimL family protein N-acetyltransferase
VTPPILETERLRLRPAEAADLDPIAGFWADLSVVRFIGGKPRTRQEVWFALLRGAGMWDMLGFGFWTVTDRATGEIYGECGFADFKRGLPENLVPGTESGWVLGPAAWGRGIASEAVSAIHGWFDQTRPGVSHCIINPGNTGSIRVAEKTGYAQTGSTLFNGEEINTYRRGA